MPTENIDIVLKGRDDASRAFNSAAKSAGGLGNALDSVNSKVHRMRGAAQAANRSIGAFDFVVGTLNNSLEMGARLYDALTGNITAYNKAIKESVAVEEQLEKTRARQQKLQQHQDSKLSLSERIKQIEAETKALQQNIKIGENLRDLAKQTVAKQKDEAGIGGHPLSPLASVVARAGPWESTLELAESNLEKQIEVNKDYQNKLLDLQAQQQILESQLADKRNAERLAKTKKAFDDAATARKAANAKEKQMEEDHHRWRQQRIEDTIRRFAAGVKEVQDRWRDRTKQRQETHAEYINSLRAEAIGLVHGDAAKARFEASLSGVSKRSIAQGRGLQELIAKLQANTSEKTRLEDDIRTLQLRLDSNRAPRSELTAYQSRAETVGGRVLSRTLEQSAEQKQLAALKAQLEEQKKIAEKLREQQIALDKIADNTTPVKEEVLN